MVVKVESPPSPETVNSPVSESTARILEWFEEKDLHKEAVLGAAVDALTQYAETGLDRRGIDKHAERVLALVESFVSDEMLFETKMAVLLHDLGDRLLNKESPKYTKERAAAAADALAGFFASKHLTDDERQTIAHILNEMIATERASGYYRTQMAYEAEKRGGLSKQVVEVLADGYQGEVPTEVLKAIRPSVDFEHMDTFLHESEFFGAVVTKSIELLDNLHNRPSQRESAWVQDAQEALCFYSPILEAAAIDGLTMDLCSEAHKLLLHLQGESAVVERAENILNEVFYPNYGPKELIADIFGSISDVEIAKAVKENPQTKKTPVHIGEFVGKLSNDIVVGGNYRLKTGGSLAKKLVNNPELPMDIFAMTVISQNEKTLPHEFSQFIRLLQQRAMDSDDNIELKPAPSKRKAIHIQGQAGFVESIQVALQQAGVDESLYQLKPESAERVAKQGFPSFEVAKVTFMVGKVPVEIQFVTRDERERSRRGEIAHIIYKSLGKLPKNIDQLPEPEQIAIFTRRRQLAEEGMEVMRYIYGRRLGDTPYSSDSGSLDGLVGECVALEVAG